MSSGISVTSVTQVFPRPIEREPRQVAAREPLPRTDLMAAYRAAHPRLTPAQAFASKAEVSPPNTSNPLTSDYVEKLNTEISVNGKVIARIYNSGAMVIASEYSFLSDEIGIGGEAKTGPALAEDRANRIRAVLQKYGAVVPDEQESAKIPLRQYDSPDPANSESGYRPDSGRLDRGTGRAGAYRSGDAVFPHGLTAAHRNRKQPAPMKRRQTFRATG